MSYHHQFDEPRLLVSDSIRHIVNLQDNDPSLVEVKLGTGESITGFFKLIRVKNTSGPVIEISLAFELPNEAARNASKILLHKIEKISLGGNTVAMLPHLLSGSVKKEEGAFKCRLILEIDNT